MTSANAASTSVPNGAAAREPMPIVPVGLRVEGRRVVVVGAGRIAARKAAAYIDRGADVVVIAPVHSPAMAALTDIAERHHRPFHETDLHTAWLAVAATGIPRVDGEVFAAAEQRRVWCNAADDPEHCSVILPAVSRAGPITISISTGGTSPATASWLRRRIDDLLDDDTLRSAHIAAAVRADMQAIGLPTETPTWAPILDRYGAEPHHLEQHLRHALLPGVTSEEFVVRAAPHALDGRSRR